MAEAQTNESTFDGVQKLVFDLCAGNIEDIKPESRLVDDLGLDSLDAVTLAVDLESYFEIEVPDEEFERLKTVADVVRYVDEHRK